MVLRKCHARGPLRACEVIAISPPQVDDGKVHGVTKVSRSRASPSVRSDSYVTPQVDDGVRPNVVTFASLVSACGKAGQCEEAFKVRPIGLS
eukprot:285613-Prorocentrum_minimum.AAC.1